MSFFFVSFFLYFTNSDDMLLEREKNKLLQEEMESTLHDIQNM